MGPKYLDTIITLKKLDPRTQNWANVYQERLLNRGLRRKPLMAAVNFVLIKLVLKHIITFKRQVGFGLNLNPHFPKNTSHQLSQDNKQKKNSLPHLDTVAHY